MKKYLNGKMVEMTSEELAAYLKERESNAEEVTKEVSDTERIEALEAALLELMGVVLNG